MKQNDNKYIEKIIGGMTCPKDFKCYKSGFENLCKAKDGGLKGYLDCLEETPQKCKFALAFGHGYFCRCPLRIYISKGLKN